MKFSLRAGSAPARVLSVLGTMGEQLSELFGAGTDEPSDNKQKGSDDIS